MVITFFGHSRGHYKKELKRETLTLIEEVAKGEPVDFYLGGYGDFDIFAMQTAQEYKKKHPNSKLIFITPYLGRWLDERKELIEKSYDEIIYPEIEKTPFRYAILKRNEWMVRNADYVIAYVMTHIKSGAYQALHYAHKKNIPYTNLYEREMRSILK